VSAVGYLPLALLAAILIALVWMIAYKRRRQRDDPDA